MPKVWVYGYGPGPMDSSWSGPQVAILSGPAEDVDVTGYPRWPRGRRRIDDVYIAAWEFRFVFGLDPPAPGEHFVMDVKAEKEGEDE